MTPSISDRIDSLIQAMSDIVLPAVDAEKSLAREQAQLVIAHLQLMKRQLPKAAAFDQLELKAEIMLAERLLELEDATPSLSVFRNALESAVSYAQDVDDLSKASRFLNSEIERYVRALRRHANRVTSDAMTAAVLAHARDKAMRNRIWFSTNGFDAERDSLPSPDSLFACKP